LLAYLKSLHGETAEDVPQKVTLRRKQTLNLSTGSGSSKRTVNVEVRKKRTYVKKSESDQAEEVVTEVEEPQLETAAETVENPVAATVAAVETAHKEAVEADEVANEVAVTPPPAAKEDHSKAKKGKKTRHVEKEEEDGEEGPKGKKGNLKEKKAPR
jgi:Bacterial translation initiation factor IF-2 associated region.